MKQVLRLAAAPASAALFALAVLAMATPASAAKYEYCHTDTSGIRGCGYETMEQCQAAFSGRGGGGCYRDPFLPEASNPSNALAYQPKQGAAHHQKKPVDNH